MTEGAIFHIGGSEAEYLDVQILRRSWPEASDYWDGNWLVARVRIAVGAFSGSFEASFRTDDLSRFRSEAATLYEELKGAARFSPLEEQLLLEMTCDKAGHVFVDAQARDVAGTGTRIIFELDMDQTELKVLVGQLDAILDNFPVVGSPAA